MGRYNVVITETETRTYKVEVEAANSDEAEDMAHDILMYAIEEDNIEEYLSYELYEMETNADGVSQCG